MVADPLNADFAITPEEQPAEIAARAKLEQSRPQPPDSKAGVQVGLAKLPRQLLESRQDRSVFSGGQLGEFCGGGL